MFFVRVYCVSIRRITQFDWHFLRTQYSIEGGWRSMKSDRNFVCVSKHTQKSFRLELMRKLCMYLAWQQITKEIQQQQQLKQRSSLLVLTCKKQTHTHTHHVHSARLNHFYDLIIRIDIVYTQEMPSAIDAFNLYRFGIFGCLLHHTKSENGRNFIWNGVKEHMT